MTINRAQTFINIGNPQDASSLLNRFKTINDKLAAASGNSPAARIRGTMFTIPYGRPKGSPGGNTGPNFLARAVSQETAPGGRLYIIDNPTITGTGLESLNSIDWLMPLNFNQPGTSTSEIPYVKQAFNAIANGSWYSGWEGYNRDPSGKGVLKDYEDFAIALRDDSIAKKYTHYIRLGWEFNGAWYGWGAVRNPTNPALDTTQEFKAAFKAVSDTMKAVNPDLKIVWCPSLGPITVASTAANLLDLAWPSSDSAVDLVGVDVYHRPGPGQRLVSPTTFANTFAKKLAIIRNIASSKGKPICIPEWACGQTDVQGLEWLRQMALWMSTLPDSPNAGSLAFHGWFSPPKAEGTDGGGVLIDGFTDIITPELGALGHKRIDTSAWYTKYFGALQSPANVPPFPSSDLAVGALVISTPSVLPNATVGTAYPAVTLNATTTTVTTAGTTVTNTPATWAVATGSALPAGMTLVNGVLGGTPTQAGTFFFTLQATAGTRVTTKQFTITAIGTVVITTNTLPVAKVGSAYSAVLTATGGTTYTWSIPSAQLPPGLSVSGGVISGTPTVAGIYSLDVTVSSGGVTATKTLPITVAGGVSVELPRLSNVKTTVFQIPDLAFDVVYDGSLYFPSVRYEPFINLRIGQAVSKQFVAYDNTKGGVPIPTNSPWTIVSGSFPPGVTMSGTGLVTGTPVGKISYPNVQVQVTYAGLTASAYVSIRWV